MGIRYHVLVNDLLMDENPQWPEGFRPVERESAGHPGTHWWLFEDDNAPAELEGKRVEVHFARASGIAREHSGELLGDGQVHIVRRQALDAPDLAQDR